MIINLNFPGDQSVSLSVKVNDGLITGVGFVPANKLQNTSTLFDESVYQSITKEFFEYFNNPQFKFSLACDLNKGTAFQQRVWQALITIPAGKNMTYGQLAKQLKTSPRAVGNACRHNPIPIIIPCHRVVSASGPGGYAGDTLEHQKGNVNFLQIKQWLINHEQSQA